MTKYESLASSKVSSTSFWKSVDIMMKKPHVVNKRLWGAKTLFTCVCRPINKSIWDISLLHSKYVFRRDDYKARILNELQLTQCSESECAMEVTFIELFPKTYTEEHAFQLVISRKQEGIVTFLNVSPEEQTLCPKFSYSFQFIDGKIWLIAVCEQSSKSVQWLKDTVLQQLVKWSEECNSKTERQNNICNDSLCLVSNERYYKKYNDLKVKYGKEMVKIWPECTDPSKFVYEDIAIATYLLLLWEDERHLQNTKDYQTFVDLGCGNGLLVYILAMEGHCGTGIDVRKRQIWDMYPKETILEERTITPSDSHLFPNTDWVIGNHSDELTPWIPVIAARSSYKCNFFLLPCCAYNFDGSKYKRQDSSKSQYTEYLQYIKHLCEQCGFRTDIDRLKIPSTKRICLVGRGRTYPEHEFSEHCNKIQGVISDQSTIEGNNDQSWIQDFKAREPVERVKNCTQIDKDLIKQIVETISDYLLEGCTLDSSWYSGKSVDIIEVVRLISIENLKSLKSECGGLQTLLKNNHHIFKVQSGKVELRYPKTIKQVKDSYKYVKNKNPPKIKQKPCWFHNYHPQGCPLQDIDCSFLHVNR